MKRTILITSVLCLAALTSGHTTPASWWSADTNQSQSLDAVFGEGADSAWTVQGKFTVADDAMLHAPVLTVSKDGLTLDGKTTYTGDQELHARVRLRTDQTPGPYALLYLAKGDTNSPAFYLHLGTAKAAQRVDCYAYRVVGGKQNLPLNDIAALTTKLDWASPAQNYFGYTLRAYNQIQPGWPEDFRVRVEHDMASLPDLDAKWLDVRIELRKGQIRFWVDDHLVSQANDPAIKPEGTTEIRLAPGVQIASYRINRLDPPVKEFVPIRLAGYANGRAFFAGQSIQWSSMPPKDNMVNVDGVPFIFSGINPEGNDHLDLGRSLYRQGSLEGYFPASQESWVGSSSRDPARIQLRVPNAQYDALYVIAASDDDRNNVPIVTAMFYRPNAGFSEQFEGTVPLASAKHPSPDPLSQGEREKKTETKPSGSPTPSGEQKKSSPLAGEDKGEGYSVTSTEAKPLPVLLSNGTPANLWLVKIPLDPEKLTSLSDLDIVEIELTKKVHQYRSYPDPIMYGWHQGGLPSAVHVYAATLGEVPIGFDWQPDKFGHVWQGPAEPGYTATLTNHTAKAETGKITVVTKSYDGTEETKQEKPVTIGPNVATKVQFPVPVKLFGSHDITATLEIGGRKWTEKRSFVKLAPDTRAPKWTEGKGVLFGYWSYHGGHYTPKADLIVDLMTMAGGRTSIGIPNPTNAMIQAHWAPIAAGAWEVAPQPWAAKEPYDPKEYEAYKKKVIEVYTKAREAVPAQYRPDQVYFFAEPHISARLTDGNFSPTYWGEPEWQYTKEEKERIRMFNVTAKCAAEAIRSQWPNLKVLIPYGDALFVPPILRAGFPKNLIDGSGIDTPTFERVPEQQLHQISPHRFYILRKEYEKAGIPNPNLFYIEGTFVPTEVGSCTWQEQMDYYNRWALISMAYGVQRFYSGWFAFDCGSYYGAEHYGGCGIQRRIPYCDPKPAYAAFATMTDKLDQANFDGWVKTGSLTTYCLRFKGPKGNVYAMWSIRGKRPVTIKLAAEVEVGITDSMNNTKLIKSPNKQVTFTIDSDVRYVTGPGEIVSVEVGAEDNSDSWNAAVPGGETSPSTAAEGGVPSQRTVIADLGDGTWKYTSERDLFYENNNYDTYRYLGNFSVSIANDPTYPSPYPLPQGARGPKAEPKQSGRLSPTGNRPLLLEKSKVARRKWPPTFPLPLRERIKVRGVFPNLKVRGIVLSPKSSSPNSRSRRRCTS